MAEHIKALLCILLINTIVVILYLVWNLRKKRKGCVIQATMMFLCPIIGPAFFLFSFMMYKLFFSEPVDLADIVFSKERVESFTHAEEERERNMVPLEEAIEITGDKELRALMMNVVRGDIHKFLASIALALNSEDTETAHYAASVLQDALNGFRMSVEKQRQIIYEEPHNQLILIEQLIDYMNQVLEQKVFTDLEQKEYVYIMEEICELFYEKAPGRITSHQYEAISLRLLEIGDYEGCKKWCERTHYHYPNTLSTYTCQLKLYFTWGKKDKFFDVVEELKQSTVVVDSETLALLRVFR